MHFYCSVESCVKRRNPQRQTIDEDTMLRQTVDKRENFKFNPNQESECHLDFDSKICAKRASRQALIATSRCTSSLKLIALGTLALILGMLAPTQRAGVSAKLATHIPNTSKRIVAPQSDSAAAVVVAGSDGDNDSTGTDAKAGGIYDNRITGEPEIECGYGVVHFRVFTEKGRASAIFVRGQAGNPDCMFHDASNVTIELTKCNIRRKREVNPTGVAYQMTLVVQMHPLFVTKVDRAYNVNCFYMERNQDVGTEFNVSDLQPSELMMDAVLPNCTYAVHRDSSHGPLIRYTKVGEQIYHVWECPSTMYKMLLYNCVAIDGKGGEYGIIDENGCSKDEFLMPQISYTAEGTKAMVASSAFNFPDRNTMAFTCRIRLCYTNECSAITPPKCGSSGKRGSSLSEDLDADELQRRRSSTTIVAASSTEIDEDLADAAATGDFATFESRESTTRVATSRARASAARQRTTIAASSAEEETTELRGDEEEDTTTTTVKSTTTEKVSTTTPRRQSTHSIAEEDEQEETDQEGAHSTPVAVPEDFPRPGALNVDAKQADEPLEDGSGEIPTAPDEEWARKHSEFKKLRDDASNSVELLNKDEIVVENTPPMLVFNKVSPTKAAHANAKNAAEARGDGSSNRLARDTTLPGSPLRRSVGVAPKHFVDFDISSDEITIMDAGTDDFIKPSNSEKSATGAKKRADALDELTRYDGALPLLFDAPSATGSTTRLERAVCFSPLALTLAGALSMLLLVGVGFVLLRAVRVKSVHIF